MAESRKLRVLIAKPGLDGHDRGAKIVARALRDAGFEVIYTGLHQTPEMIVEAAIQEDVDAVGLSILSGAHLTLFPAVVQLLKDKGLADVKVFGGGIIPADDIPKLKAQGVAELAGLRDCDERRGRVADGKALDVGGPGDQQLIIPEPQDMKGRRVRHRSLVLPAGVVLPGDAVGSHQRREGAVG